MVPNVNFLNSEQLKFHNKVPTLISVSSFVKIKIFYSNEK